MIERGRSTGVAAMAVLLWAASALTASSLRAQSAAESRVLRFEDAVEMALERNTDLLRARTDVELQGAVETRQWMDFLPQVTVDARGRRSFGRSFSQEEGRILSESNDFFDTGVRASVELFTGWERTASLRSASLREQASRLRYERTREDVLYEVVQGYTTLVLDRELASVREEEVSAAEELLEQVRRLVELGRQPASDLYQQQAVLAQAEAALVEARRQVELTETSLMQVLELDPLATYEFVAPGLPDGPVEAVEYDLASLLQRALSRRADVGALEQSLEATDAGVTAAQSGYWPSLSLSMDYGSNWSSNAVQPGPDFFDQLSGRRGGNVSLSLSLPLFDRLQTRVAVEQAEVAKRIARYDLQDRRQQVALQVRQAVLDHRSAAAQQAATERQLAAAERAWQAADRRYELGAATFVEVVQARASLASARSAAVRSRFNVLLAERRIAYHTGAPDSGAALFTRLQED